MLTPVPPARLDARLAEIYRELGPLYRDVQRLVEQREATMGMSVGVRAVLDELASHAPGLPVPAVATQLGLSRQFVQRMVNDAADAGWVERIPNPNHRRSRVIRLTDAGTAAISTVREHERELMGQTGGDLTEADLEATLRVLRAMREAVHTLR